MATTKTIENSSSDALRECVLGLKAAVKIARNKPSAIYTPAALDDALTVQESAPDAYRVIVDRVSKLRSGELRRWEGAVKERRKAKKTERPAQSGYTLMELYSSMAEGGHDDAELYDLSTGLSAHQQGIKRMTDTVEGDDECKGMVGAITNVGAIARLLLLMNRDYALATVGTSVRVVKTDPNGEAVFLRTEEVAKIFDNVRIGLSRSVLSMQLSAHTINLFDVWRQWPKRRTYDSVGFYPGSERYPSSAPNGCLNLWTGFAVKPKKGKWSKLHRHLKEIICDGDPEKLTWLLDWMADLIQRPQVKPGTALVLRSPEEGTGKSLLINALLAKIFGRYSLMTTKSDHITGRFNGHMKALVLLGAEEAVWAGSKAAEGTLKELITAERLTYEHKGLEAYEDTNYLRVIMFSNEAWSVPAGPFSRRYFVLDVNPRRRGDNAYFAALHDELENGGVEAFLRDMLDRDIISELRVAPVTEGLRTQRELSLDAVGRWVVKFARDGYVSDPEGKVEHSLRDKEETTIKAESFRRCFPRSQNQYDTKSFDTRLGHLLTKLGVQSTRAMRDRKRSSWYVFPSLHDFQAAAQKHFNVPVSDGFGDVEAAAKWLRKKIDRDTTVAIPRLQKMAERDGIDWITVKSAIKATGMEYEPYDDGKTYVQWPDEALAERA